MRITPIWAYRRVVCGNAANHAGLDGGGVGTKAAIVWGQLLVCKTRNHTCQPTIREKGQRGENENTRKDKRKSRESEPSLTKCRGEKDSIATQ